MLTRATLEQFDSLQRESELVLDHLRKALPFSPPPLEEGQGGFRFGSHRPRLR